MGIIDRISAFSSQWPAVPKLIDRRVWKIVEVALTLIVVVWTGFLLAAWRAESYYWKGCDLMGKGEIKGALEEFKNSLWWANSTLAPNICWKLGACFQTLGRFEERESILTRGLSYPPSRSPHWHSMLFLSRGSSRAESGKTEEALTDLKNALKWCDDRDLYLQAKIQLCIGKCFCALRRFDEALAAFNAGLKKDPMGRNLLSNEPEKTLFNLIAAKGRLFWEKEEHLTAQNYFKATLDDRDFSPILKAEIGCYAGNLIRTRDIHAANEIYTKAIQEIEKAPITPTSQWWHARLLFYRGGYSSLQDYLKAWELLLNHSDKNQKHLRGEIAMIIGNIYKSQHNSSEALVYLQHALELCEEALKPDIQDSIKTLQLPS